MNISNNRFTNITPSIFNHEHCISADVDNMNFSSFRRVEIPVVSRENTEIADFIRNSSLSQHKPIENVAFQSAFPKAEKLRHDFVCSETLNADLNARKMNCDISSVVSLGSDYSNASYQKAEASPRLCSKSVDNDKFLHRACQLFPTSPEIIHSALLADSEAIRRQEKLPVTATGAKRALQRQRCPKSEPYTLPINIALKHKASLEVLKILVDAGLDTLELRDGYEKSTPLNVALKMNPRDVPTIDLLLFSNAKCAMVSDRRQNYPLHIACSRGSCLEVVLHLYSVYPDALSMRNFSGETPLDIAKRCSLCPEEVLNFLHTKSRCGKQEDV